MVIMENSSITISISIPASIVHKVEELQQRRADPTRSDTIRILLLRALADFNFLTAEEERAMGIKRIKEGY